MLIGKAMRWLSADGLAHRAIAGAQCHPIQCLQEFTALFVATAGLSLSPDQEYREDIMRLAVVAGCIAFASVATFPGAAQAQQLWPTAPVRILVANSPGTATDLAARIFADNLSRNIGQSVVVENRPGADGYIAAVQVAHSAPDGYTLFFASQSIFGIDPHLKKEMPVDPDRDFTHVAIMIDDTGPIGLYAYPPLPFTTIPEMVGYAKANPGKLTFATIVPTFSLIGAWINKRSGIELLEIKYKSGAQGLQDVLSGRVSLYLDTFGPTEPYIKAGKLRVLAVTRRVDDYPQFPTFESVYPGYRQPSFVVLVGPAGMPAGLTKRINRVSATVVENPKFNQDLAKLRWRNIEGARTPQGATELLRRGRADWGAFIQEIGITPE